MTVHAPPAGLQLAALPLDRVGVGPGVRLLDVDCGRLSIAAARSGARVTTVDPWTSQLEFPDDSFHVAAGRWAACPLTEMVRVTRRGGHVLLVEDLDPEAEALRYVLAALRVVTPARAPLRPPDSRRELTDAGLTDIRVEPVSWDLPCTSGRALWDAVMAVGGRDLGVDLTEAEAIEVHAVLDGMVRERAGGAPPAVLRNALRITIGTKPMARLPTS